MDARVFLPPDAADGTSVNLSGDSFHHLVRVRRLKPGDRFVAVVGDQPWQSELTDIQDGAAAGRLIKRLPSREPPLDVHLVQGLAKGKKLESVIEKATETGVHTVWPVDCRRTVVKWSKNKLKSKVERWRRIAEAAAKQSGRTRIPRIPMVQDWSDWWQQIAPSLVEAGAELIVCWEDEPERGLRQALNPGPATVVLGVGPEGGLHPEEIEQAAAAGATVVSLGPRILRTETAGPLAVGLVLYALGDMGRAPGF